MIRYLAHRLRGHYMRRIYWQSPGASYGVRRFHCWTCSRGWGSSL